MLSDNSRVYSPASAEIAQYLNVENAKIFACLMVIAFAVYHGLIHARYGGDSCDWLLTEGRFQGDNIWQPFGCMVHKYTTSETRNCLHYISYWGGKNHIVFMGDSRVRQQYHEFVSLVTGSESVDKEHHDLHYTDDNFNLEVKFLWQPVMNESMHEQYESWLQEVNTRPSVLVTGSGPWTMKFYNGTTEGLQVYRSNLSSLVQVLNRFENSTKILWMLQEPVDEKQCSNHSRDFLTNAQMNSYNRAVQDILGDSSVRIWSSSKKIAEGLPEDNTDGLHLGKLILSWDSQILVNLYCNDHMNFDDGTCCASREPVTALQVVTACFFGVCLFISLCMFLWKRKKKKVPTATLR